MLQIHFRHILGGHPTPCRYEKLRNVGDARPRRRWVKKMSGGLKGLRLSRSRKLSLKTICIMVLANRITRICADIADRMKMDGIPGPNIIFATHWGLPALSHPGRLSSLSTQV